MRTKHKKTKNCLFHNLEKQPLAKCPISIKKAFKVVTMYVPSASQGDELYYFLGWLVGLMALLSNSSSTPVATFRVT